MKQFTGVLLLAAMTMANAASTKSPRFDRGMCLVSYSILDDCRFNNMHVAIITKQLSANNKQLLELRVRDGNKTYMLPVSKNTKIGKGGRGYILFEDINFDKIADIALTTSFSTTDQHLDYWVYNSGTAKYDYIGNYPDFTIDKKYKWLINIVRIGPDKYTTHIYDWRAGKLHKIAH